MVIEVRLAVTSEMYLMMEMRGKLWDAGDVLYLHWSGCIFKMGLLKCI